MDQVKLRAVFMRGGTSRALIFRRSDLPAEQADWAPIFLAAMGSPDPNGRQVDGMGGGISSLSKVCVVGPSERADADVDYTFAQISIKDAGVDYSGNCGNMSSAIGPYAIEEGLVKPASPHEGVVRIYNTNTHKIIVSRFPLVNSEVAVEGAMELPGIPGSGAPVRLEFMQPGGAGTGQLLPTGKPIDLLQVPGMDRPIAASMVDAANPCVFVAASDLGVQGTEMPAALDVDAALLSRLEAIRRAASVAMGIAATPEEAARIPSIPKVGFVSGPQAASTLSGDALGADAVDVTARMISVGQPHRAFPLTGAMCLAVAARIEGTVVQRVTRVPAKPNEDLRIGQPSGLTVVSAAVHRAADGWVADSAVVYRTARRLMEGLVCVRASRLGAAQRRTAAGATAPVTTHPEHSLA